MTTVLGIDVGGTGIKGAPVGSSPTVTASSPRSRPRPTPSRA